MATFIYINDVSLQTYRVGVDNDGFLESTPVASQVPAPIYLNDSPGNTKTFLLTVITEGGFGYLQTEEQAFTPGEDLGLTLISENGTPYEVRVDVDGILATYPGVATEPVLEIAGHSSLLLVPDPNWREPVEEAHEYLTDVLTGYNESEQRIRLRSAPRLRVGYHLTLLTAAEKQRFKSLLWRLRADRVLLPLWQDTAKLEAAATTGDTFLELTAATRRFRAGKYAMLWRDSGDYEIVQVEAVDPPGEGDEAHILQHGLSLADPVGLTWASDGRTWVIPLLSARLENVPELLHPTSRVMELDVKAISETLPDPADALHLHSGSAAISQSMTTPFDDDRGVLFHDFLLQYLPDDAVVTKVYAVADAEFVAPEEFPCAARVAFGDETLPVGVLDTNGDEIVADSETGGFDGTFVVDVAGSDYEFIGSGLTIQQWIANARIQAATGHSLLLTDLADLLNVRGVGFAIVYTSANPVDGSDTMPVPVALAPGEGLAWAYPSAVTVAEPDDGHGLATGGPAEWVGTPPTWDFAYRELDVWPYEPDRAGTIAASWRRSLHHLDPGPGTRAAWDRAGVPIISRESREWIHTSRAEIDRWLTFLQRRAGQLVPFWTPTFNSDLQMSANLSQGETELHITDVGYRTGPFLAAGRRHVALIVSEAEQYYREVIDAAAGDDGEEILTLSEALPVDISTRTLVSYLVLERQAADEARLSWQTVHVATAPLETRELPVEMEVVGS